MEQKKLLLRIGEGAEVLSISKSKCYAMAAAGELPTIRVGKSIRIPADALHEWLAAQIAGMGPITPIASKVR